MQRKILATLVLSTFAASSVNAAMSNPYSAVYDNNLGQKVTPADSVQDNAIYRAADKLVDGINKNSQGVEDAKQGVLQAQYAANEAKTGLVGKATTADVTALETKMVNKLDELSNALTKSIDSRVNSLDDHKAEKTDLTAETNRAITAEQQINTALAGKVNQHEYDLDKIGYINQADDLNNRVANNTAKIDVESNARQRNVSDLESKISHNADQIAQENTRATGEEAKLAGDVATAQQIADAGLKAAGNAQSTADKTADGLKGKVNVKEQTLKDDKQDLRLTTHDATLASHGKSIDALKLGVAENASDIVALQKDMNGKASDADLKSLEGGYQRFVTAQTDTNDKLNAGIKAETARAGGVENILAGRLDGHDTELGKKASQDELNTLKGDVSANKTAAATAQTTADDAKAGLAGKVDFFAQGVKDGEQDAKITANEGTLSTLTTTVGTNKTDLDNLAAAHRSTASRLNDLENTQAAKNGELSTKITAEETRAKGVEAQLTSDMAGKVSLDDLKTTRDDVAQNKKDISDVRALATDAGTKAGLAADAAKGAQTSANNAIDGLKGKVDVLSQTLKDDVQNAKLASNESAIADETSARQRNVTDLHDKVDHVNDQLVQERNRATGEEDALRAGVTKAQSTSDQAVDGLKDKVDVKTQTLKDNAQDAHLATHDNQLNGLNSWVDSLNGTVQQQAIDNKDRDTAISKNTADISDVQNQTHNVGNVAANAQATADKAVNGLKGKVDVLPQKLKDEAQDAKLASHDAKLATQDTLNQGFANILNAHDTVLAEQKDKLDKTATKDEVANISADIHSNVAKVAGVAAGAKQTADANATRLTALESAPKPTNGVNGLNGKDGVNGKDADMTLVTKAQNTADDAHTLATKVSADMTTKANQADLNATNDNVQKVADAVNTVGTQTSLLTAATVGQEKRIGALEGDKADKADLAQEGAVRAVQTKSNADAISQESKSRAEADTYLDGKIASNTAVATAAKAQANANADSIDQTQGALRNVANAVSTPNVRKLAGNSRVDDASTVIANQIVANSQIASAAQAAAINAQANADNNAAAIAQETKTRSSQFITLQSGVIQNEQAVKTEASARVAGDRQTLADANAYTDSRVAGLEQSNKDMKRQIHDNSQKIKKIGAMTQAVASLHYNGLVSGYGVAAGTYDGATAIAAGTQFQTSAHTAATLQVSWDGNATGAGVGFHGDF